MKNIFKTVSLFFAAATLFTACDKNFNGPPLPSIPQGGTVTIADLQTISLPHKFLGDSSLFAVITMDESSGNIFKNIYIKDITGALNVRLLNSGNVAVGDSIRIALKGVVLSDFQGVLQLDSVDTDNNIIIQKNGLTVTPKTVTIDQIQNDATLISHLVKIENVEFTSSDVGQFYADAVNQKSMNRNLEDCNSNTLIVRTSGFADFANQPVSGNKGSVIGIVSQFGIDKQLFARSLQDIALTDSIRCDGSTSGGGGGNGGGGNGGGFVKDFEDGSLTSGGWTTFDVTGAQVWENKWFGTNVGVISGHVGGGSGSDFDNEDWLISPIINIDQFTSVNLNFESANAFDGTGTKLELLISTNYDGSSNPNNSIWSTLTFTAGPPTSQFPFTPSGNIDLSLFNQPNTHFAFKYTSTTSAASTWELNNIIVTVQ